MIPVLAVPLLREDSVFAAMYDVVFEMKETVEVLMNGVNARVMTYLVPKTALARFDGLDSINKSYSGLPPVEGGDVVPWFETMVAPAHGANAILKKMGKHARPGTTINTEYIEAYNAIWNFRAKNRSPDITLRDRLDATLAKAFWTHENFAHIVPEFDQAIIDGEVPLNVVNGNLALSQNFATVSGSGDGQPVFKSHNDPDVNERMLVMSVGGNNATWNNGPNATGVAKWIDPKLQASLTGITAELAQNGITVSLSNIELARKTQAFAALRRQYGGHSDEYIIDLLMQGITIPELAWNQPILLADQRTVFGMSKRYATDAENLTESVVNGITAVQQRFRCPPVGMGGVIMMVVEVTPEQLFERQKDPYLHATSAANLPDALRDMLDPEKVVIVKNDEVDLDHDQPDDTFGYAPLNHEWARSVPQVGGKFYRPSVNAPFDEDRQRIWAVETENPVLSEDFYLCTSMHQKPFVMTTGDNFEVLVRGEAAIRGLTQFGGALIEATEDYAKVMEKAPPERIDQGE